MIAEPKRQRVNNKKSCINLNRNGRLKHPEKLQFGTSRFASDDCAQLQIKHKNSHLPKRKVKTWTTEQDQKLMELYSQYPKKWSSISSLMTDRNENQCLHRYRRLSQLGINRKIWSSEEDETIVRMIRKVGKNWKLLSEMLQTKTGKQIRERFINKLDPKIKKEEWTEDEDRAIIELYLKIGSRWSEISKKVPGRPQNKIKNRFYSYIQKNYDIQYVSSEPEQGSSSSVQAESKAPLIHKKRVAFGDISNNVKAEDEELKVEPGKDSPFIYHGHKNAKMPFRSSLEDIHQAPPSNFQISVQCQNLTPHKEAHHFSQSFRSIEGEVKEDARRSESRVENADSMGYIAESSRLYLRSLINMEEEWATINNPPEPTGVQGQTEHRSYESIKYHDFEFEQILPSKEQLGSQSERKAGKPGNYEVNQQSGFLENYYNSFGQSNACDLIFLGSNMYY